MKKNILNQISLLTILALCCIVYDTNAGQLIADKQAGQSAGNYQPMNMGYAGFNALGMTQSAWLDPLQNLGEGQSKPAYSKYYWTPDLVLPIRVREGMMTLINFPEWELIEDVYIGDNSTFDGQISGPNAVLLYPRKGANVGVDTNLIIFGRSGNKYVFYMKSESYNTERLTNSIIDIEVIQDGEGGVAGASKSSGGHVSKSGSGFGKAGANSADSTFTKRFRKDDWMKEIPVSPDEFRFDIEIYVPNPEDVIIAPERVWRDDIFTYIDFGERAINMVQRPIVTLIVERSEVPVGFRTAGPNGRMIIVEGVGDMVLKNGKRIVCLKLRRDPSRGLEHASFADNLPQEWDIAPKIPTGKDTKANNKAQGSPAYPGYPSIFDGGNTANPSGVIPTSNQMMQMDSISNYQNSNGVANFNNQIPSRYGFGGKFMDKNSTISIELGTDIKVENLEDLWDKLSGKYKKILGGYEPYFSVDTAASGSSRELFHLRVGPVKDLNTGDTICGKLGRNGVFCSVVRTQ